MVVIYVQKSWLETIGEVKDLLVVWPAGDEYVSLLGESAANGFPFVDARLLVKDPSGGLSIRSDIPANLISGIFDLTKEEASKLGFHPPTKK